MNASNLAISGEHGRCAPPGEACPLCMAYHWLEAEDWLVLEFFRNVQDQVVNLTPNGTAEGKFVFAPRIEGWLAVCEMLQVDKDFRMEVIEQARMIFEAVNERVWELGLFKLDPETLRAPEI